MDKEDSMKTLCGIFESELKILMPHEYRIYHQHKTIRQLKQNLKQNECIIQIDFSENYNTKAAVEIQSMHFGASRAQVSLHTCHLTYCDKESQKLATTCYCTLSDDTRHSTPAVWAHLNPILEILSKRFDTM